MSFPKYIDCLSDFLVKHFFKSFPHKKKESQIVMAFYIVRIVDSDTWYKVFSIIYTVFFLLYTLIHKTESL